ncbi:WD40 repeat domain-containing serine/threonine protein kinase [Actinocorallia populi]|uniref:WD40 repeat domain-containing serine/threonine protein kinase n=1 Tax=Actinocorallia populi TaxID=2079200 RepID=UPI000D090EEB|nr:serine/threonine-protein kinase [Actinocorallia populi]
MRVGLELAGRYRLVRSVGRGGFGEVWAADDLLLDRSVAVKFLYREVVSKSPVWLSKFKQEARIAARLDHPGITAVDNVGEYDGQWYLVMEFLPGRDLARELESHPSGLPVDRALDLGAQVAEALAAAHGHGIVHRDLKPGNLMLLDGDRVKICDFGIARIAEATATHTLNGTVTGTPAFMAPEQWLGGAVDHRTDLYALGGILYALLTGGTPFPGPSVPALMGQHLHVPPTPPGEARAGIPAEADRLVLDLLAKDPDRRPASAARVGEALRAVIVRMSAPPDPPPSAPRSGGRVLTGHTSAVSTVAFNPDGTVLVSGGDDGTVRLWDPDSGRTTRRLADQTGRVLLTAFGSGGTLLSGGDDATAHLRDLATDRTSRLLTSHPGPVHAMAFSPDGTVLVTGGDDASVRLWGGVTARPIRVLTGHTKPVRAVAFSPDGTILASGGDDGTVRLWNPGSGRLLGALTGHSGAVNSAAFSPDGEILATAGDDAAVYLWHVAAANAIRVLTDHPGPVRAVAFAPDGAVLASGGDDGTTLLWNMASATPLRDLTAHTGPVRALAFAPRTPALATASADKTLRIHPL